MHVIDGVGMGRKEKHISSSPNKQLITTIVFLSINSIRFLFIMLVVSHLSPPTCLDRQDPKTEAAELVERCWIPTTNERLLQK